MIQRKMSDITLKIEKFTTFYRKLRCCGGTGKIGISYVLQTFLFMIAVTNSLQIHNSNFRITRYGVMCAVHQYVLHFSDQNGFPHPVHRQNSEVNQ